MGNILVEREAAKAESLAEKTGKLKDEILALERVATDMDLPKSSRTHAVNALAHKRDLLDRTVERAARAARTPAERKADSERFASTLATAFPGWEISTTPDLGIAAASGPEGQRVTLTDAGEIKVTLRCQLELASLATFLVKGLKVGN